VQKDAASTLRTELSGSVLRILSAKFTLSTNIIIIIFGRRLNPPNDRTNISAALSSLPVFV
jgi:hypothetical protein